MATKKRLEGRVLSVLIADQDHSLVSTARDQGQVTIVSEEEVAEIAALCTAFNFVSALA